MSVTFYADRDRTPVGWTVCCYNYDNAHFTSEIRPTEQEALAAHEREHAGLPYCDGDHARLAYDTDTDPQVNLANANAQMILELLGVTDSDPDEGLCGSMSAELFTGAVLLALGLLPQDAGRPTVTIPGPGATMVDCGRPEGYQQDVLKRLQDVGMFAIARQARVVWG